LVVDGGASTGVIAELVMLAAAGATSLRRLTQTSRRAE
jgi:hypothetical protein